MVMMMMDLFLFYYTDGYTIGNVIYDSIILIIIIIFVASLIILIIMYSQHTHPLSLRQEVVVMCLESILTDSIDIDYGSVLSSQRKQDIIAGIDLSFYLFIDQSIHQSIHSSIYQPIPSIHPSIHPFIHLPLSIHPTTHPIYPSIYISTRHHIIPGGPIQHQLSVLAAPDIGN